VDTEVQNILKLLTSTFEKNAWHGPSVKQVLGEITSEQAQKKLGHTHSIIELVAHMTSWRIYVIKKLEGESNYEVKEAMNFPIATDWTKTLDDLYLSQLHLVDSLKNFPSSRLSDIVPQSSNSYTFYTLLHGIIHHDLYHIGQIALIKKTFG
jgi:uncharacterized damage-inducible protein DinB